MLPEMEQWNTFLRLAEHPVKLFLQGGKYGISSAGKFFGVVVLFSATNFILFLFLLYRLIAYSYTHQELGWVLGITLVGILFLIYAGYRAYFVVIIDIVRFVYCHSTPFFHRICGQIIDHASELYTAKIDGNGKKLEQIIHFTTIFSDEFGKCCPRLIQRGILFLLNRIPVVGMLRDLKQTIESNDHDKAETLLFEKVDKYVHELIFEPNNLRFIFWLFPLNIVFFLGAGIVLIR
jgi:hypothetical protein